jgi:hypothetical protein
LNQQDSSIYEMETYKSKMLQTLWKKDRRPRLRLGHYLSRDRTHLSQLLDTTKDELAAQNVTGRMSFEVDYRRGLAQRLAAFKQSIIDHWRTPNTRTSVNQLFY